MKKYLLGIIAVIAAITFSSFTQEEKKPADDIYYFYMVDENGVIPAGASVQFGGQVTLSYANANDGCTGSTNHCLRGFITQPSLPTAQSGDVQTLKN
ncbi:hypothetical protein [Lacibacter sp.]|uniref:hypothetical protein n=1 Tax=Lacibacter sp. TaxID=1915409 RepID=UPI002B4B4AB1|nr:hypothetical protein [Lacibacter sp.]HLP37021.1 hypothetical protein [Lacibacter sp.]